MRKSKFFIRPAVANIGGAMEAETISKNGRKSKSQTSRGNILIKTIFLLSFVPILMTGCTGGLSGTYNSEHGEYTVKFTSSTQCTWYQDDTFFNGTYEKTQNGYQLEIIGSAIYSNTVFIATKDGKDLIITGGVVEGERFVKQSSRESGQPSKRESGQPSKVVKKALNAVIKKDAETFFKHCYIPPAEYDYLKDMVRRDIESGNIVKFEIQDERIFGARAEVEFKLVDGNGEGTLSWELVKTSSGWKIDLAQFR